MPDTYSKLSHGQVAVGVGLGLLMLGLGLSYLLAPELIEKLYGLNVPERGNYGMHYAVGVRDIFYGALILTLTRLRQRRSLAASMGLGVLLPLGDACVVLLSEGAGLSAAWIHLAGVLMLGVAFQYIRLR